MLPARDAHDAGMALHATCDVEEQFHATLLHLLGIDHERLTFKYQGRYFRLTDVHGKVIQNALA